MRALFYWLFRLLVLLPFIVVAAGVFHTLVANDKKEAMDGVPFVVGIITLMKQFHSLYTQQILSYLGQYVRAHVDGLAGNDKDRKMEGIPGFISVFCELLCCA